MSRISIRTVLVVLVCSFALPAAASGQSAAPGRTDYAIVLDDVPLRPGVEVDLHLTVFVNEQSPCAGRTIVAVPGFAHTAATFRPLAQALFASAPLGHAACRIVALDLPGHGNSPAPTALPFGFLMLGDYVTAFLETLERLPAHGVHADAVLAHSQGGLVVQLAQQRLSTAGSSLREAHTVRDAVLLAPVPSKEVVWVFADSGFALTVLAGFIVPPPPSPPSHVEIPDAAWGPVFFSNLAGVTSPQAPSASDVAAYGYNAPEPLLSGLELVGALGLAGFDPAPPRPSVDAGIFGPESGTSLRVVTFSQDQIVRPVEGSAVYAHLTGDVTGSGVVEVAGLFAIHDFYVADPAGLLQAISGAIRLR